MNKILKFLLKSMPEIITIISLIKSKDTKALILFLMEWLDKLIAEEMKPADTKMAEYIEQKNQFMENEG